MNKKSSIRYIRYAGEELVSRAVGAPRPSMLEASDKTYTTKIGLYPTGAMTSVKDNDTSVATSAVRGVPGEGESPMESCNT